MILEKTQCPNVARQKNISLLHKLQICTHLELLSLSFPWSLPPQVIPCLFLLGFLLTKGTCLNLFFFWLLGSLLQWHPFCQTEKELPETKICYRAWGCKPTALLLNKAAMSFDPHSHLLLHNCKCNINSVNCYRCKLSWRVNSSLKSN